MQHLDGRCSSANAVQWTDTSFVATDSLRVAMQCQSWKPSSREQASMYDDGKHPMCLRLRTQRGKGARQSFKLIKIFVELQDGWMFKPPSYYVYESINTQPNDQILYQQIITRTTAASFVIEAHSTWIPYLEQHTFAIKLNVIYPHATELGMVTVPEDESARYLIYKVRNVFKFSAGCKIDILAADGTVITNMRKRAVYYYPKVHLPIRKRKLLELTDGSNGPKQPRIRRSTRTYFPSALPTDGEVIVTD